MFQFFHWKSYQKAKAEKIPKFLLPTVSSEVFRKAKNASNLYKAPDMLGGTNNAPPEPLVTWGGRTDREYLSPPLTPTRHLWLLIPGTLSVSTLWFPNTDNKSNLLEGRKA